VGGLNSRGDDCGGEGGAAPPDNVSQNFKPCFLANIPKREYRSVDDVHGMGRGSVAIAGHG
jgi:hypothetical protein